MLIIFPVYGVHYTARGISRMETKLPGPSYHTSILTSGFPEWQSGHAVEPDEAIIISHNWSELRRIMWNYVGIVRTTKRLLRAKERLELLKKEVREYYWQFHVSCPVIELRNVVEVASLIVESALARKESRGAHFSLDYPNLNPAPRDTLIQKLIGVHYSDEIE